MIRKLTLHSFGKFSKKSFVFKPVTIFLGVNESGKSTIFDALFDSICKPGKGIKAGKRLSLRYGDNRAAEIETGERGLLIDTDEFLNLYAIHAGDISLDFASGKNWMDKVKSSIFTGGIDPSKLAGEFEQLSRDKGNLSHVKKYREKTEELEKLEGGLEELKQKKEVILTSEGDVKKREKELSGLSALAAQKESELSGCRDELDQQKKIRHREDLLAMVTMVDKYRVLKDSVNNMVRFSEDISDELNRISGKINELEKMRTGLESGINHINEDISKKEENIITCENKIGRVRLTSDIASQLLGKIERGRPKPETSLKSVWNKVLLLLSIFSFSLGIAAFFVLPLIEPLVSLFGEKAFPVVRTVALALPVIVSFMMILFSRKQVTVEKIPDVSGFITKIKDEWRSRVKGGELMSEGIDGMIRELVKHQGELEDLGKQKQKVLDELNDARNRKKAEEGKLLSCEDELKEKEKEYGRCLARLGVRDRDEYIRKKEEYEHKKKELNETKEDLEEAISLYHAGDADTLRTECETRANGLLKEIHSKKIPEEEINTIIAHENETAGEVRRLQNRIMELKSAVDQEKGVVKGSLGNLPEQIREKEQSIVTCRSEIRDMEIDRKAAAIASGIFSDIAKDSTMVFIELGREISALFGDILPEARDITITDFKVGDIRVTDAGGGKRELENVSTGTHDSFLFAARLALALRSWQGEEPGIIILDEPFHALDSARKLRALELLKKFHDAHGWQVVLFSKDVHMGDDMKKILSNALVHELKLGDEQGKGKV